MINENPFYRAIVTRDTTQALQAVHNADLSKIKTAKQVIALQEQIHRYSGLPKEVSNAISNKLQDWLQKIEPINDSNDAQNTAPSPPHTLSEVAQSSEVATELAFTIAKKFVDALGPEIPQQVCFPKNNAGLPKDGLPWVSNDGTEIDMQWIIFNFSELSETEQEILAQCKIPTERLQANSKPSPYLYNYNIAWSNTGDPSISINELFSASIKCKRVVYKIVRTVFFSQNLPPEEQKQRIQKYFLKTLELFCSLAKSSDSKRLAYYYNYLDSLITQEFLSALKEHPENIFQLPSIVPESYYIENGVIVTE